jgi:UDP-N-acetylmuramoylalanine--D-glutamate ligase
MKKLEELMINHEQTIAEQAAILGSRLVAIRTANRQEIVNRFDTEDNHRMEQVTRFRGVYFIDDSRACSVNSTYYSLETIKSNIIWMAGGRDVDTNYLELIGYVSQKVKTLICIGKNNQKLIKTFQPYIADIHERQDMEDAVRAAFYSAEKGDVVLLSAGCDCDELYANYQTRGNTFKKAIAQL